MNNTYKAFLLSILIAVPSARASVTLNVSVGNLRDSSGTIVPANTTMVLVSSTSGFGSLASIGSDLTGLNLAAGSTFGTGGKVLAVAGATDLNSGDFGYGSGAIFDLTGLTGQSGTGGTDLAILWFPGLTGTSSQILGDGQSFGFFRSDTIDTATYGGAGSVPSDAITFNTPADGGSYSLAYVDTNLGGGISTGAFTAAGVVGVPEPSRSLLAFLGLVGLVWYRKRN